MLKAKAIPMMKNSMHWSSIFFTVLILSSLLALPSMAQSTDSITLHLKIDKAPKFVMIDGIGSLPKHFKEGSFQIKASETPKAIKFYRMKYKPFGMGARIQALSPIVYLHQEEHHIHIKNDKQQGYTISDPWEYQALVDEVSRNSGNTEALKQLLMANRDSAFGYTLFADRKSLFTNEELLASISHFEAQGRSGRELESMRDLVKRRGMQTPQKGGQFEVLELPDKEGLLQTVGNPEKSFMLVGFLSSGCPYSIRSLADLNSLQLRHPERIDIVNVWLDESEQVWKEAQKAAKSIITWTDTWDHTGFASGLYEIDTYPSFYLLDQSGKILLIKKGANFFKQVEREILKEKTIE
jgi:hypothetical protein